MVASTASDTKCRPYLLTGLGFCTAYLGPALIFSPSNKQQLYKEYTIRAVWEYGSELLKNFSPDCLKLFNESICSTLFPQCEIINTTVRNRTICLESCSEIKEVKCKRMVHDGLSVINRFDDAIIGIDVSELKNMLECNNLAKKSPGSTPFCYYSEALLGTSTFC